MNNNQTQKLDSHTELDLKMQLQQSPELLQLVIDNIPQSIFWKDRNGVYLGCNHSFASDAGLEKAEDIVGKTDYDLPWTKEEADFYRKCDLQVMEAGVPESHIQETQLQADGKHSWLDTNKIPLRDAQGNVIGILGTYEDITERKQAEANLKKLNEQLDIKVEERTKQLHQTETRLAQLTDNIPGMIYQLRLETDGVMCFTYISSGCREIYELEPQQIKQNYQLLFDCVHPEDLPQLHRTINNSAQRLEKWEFEWRINMPDGRQKWLKGISKPQLQSNNSIIWDGCLFDITSRKQAEFSLKEQTRLSTFRAAINSTLVVNDSLGDILHTCTQIMVDYLDAAFARIWTFNPQENILELQASAGMYTHINGSHGRIPVGKYKIGLIAQERQPHLTNSVQTDRRIGDKEWAKREGMVAFAGYPLIAGDELVGVIAMFSRHQLSASILQELSFIANEISLGIGRKQAALKVQKQAQDLQQAFQKLQSTQAQLIQTEKMSGLGQMVAGVAHEINNPVNFIHANLTHANEYAQDLVGLLELYQQNYPHPPQEIIEEIATIELDFIREDLPKLLHSMEEGTRRIQEIVLSLRNFSRLDEAEFKQIDIHEGIESTLMILHHRLKAKLNQPEIQVIKKYNQLPLVECYPSQLNQVLMNILVNAVDVLETIINPCIHISTQLINNNSIAIHIKDNGPGIDRENLTKIFNPFFTTKDIGKGTGLGLSISYQIVVDKHGGKLLCESVRGQGTEFIIQLPIESIGVLAPYQFNPSWSG